MQPFQFAMPGALRLRTVHPLIDEDGACSLVYDVERAAVFEVPEELRLHVAPALEIGNLDEELLGWLAREDLLTAESCADWSAHRLPTPRPDGLVEWLMAESRRRSARPGQEASFELTLDADQVTPAVARALAAQRVRVRLRCGGRDPLAWLGSLRADGDRPWLQAQPAVEMLVASSWTGRRAEGSSGKPGGEEPPAGRLRTLTVQCLLEGPARLIELWRWAAAIGVRSLDAICLEERAVGAAARHLGGAAVAARLRDYRWDLHAICDEIAAELEASRLPIDFQPLTRIVRRLMLGEAPALDQRQLPELPWQRLTGDDVGEWSGSPGSMCQGCWARRACSHSAYVASPLAGEDSREASRERCAFWLAEAEMAVRLYHRLTQVDAIRVRRFLDCQAPAAEVLTRLRGYGGSPAAKPS